VAERERDDEQPELRYRFGVSADADECLTD